MSITAFQPTLFSCCLGQSKNKLLQLAAVSPLWGKLTANQKREFLANEGVLESGRGYVSKTVLNRAPTRGVTTLVDQTGKKIVL